MEDLRDRIEAVVKEGEDIVRSILDGALITVSGVDEYLSRASQVRDIYVEYYAQFPEDASLLHHRMQLVADSLNMLNALGFILSDEVDFN